MSRRKHHTRSTRPARECNGHWIAGVGYGDPCPQPCRRPATRDTDVNRVKVYQLRSTT